MQPKLLTKIKAATAAEICRLFELGEEGGLLLDEQMTPDAFLKALMERGLRMDAVRFLAHALPKREGTWWACIAAREAADADGRLEYRAALEAAEKWVMKPLDESRREAMERAQEAGVATPAGLAAMAAFWAGDSVAPVGYAPVPPGETLTAQAVFGAVLGTSYRPGGEGSPEARLDQLLHQGLDIARGGSGRIGQPQGRTK